VSLTLSGMTYRQPRRRTGAAFLSHGMGGSAENVLALLHLDKWAFRLGGDYVPHNYKKERHFNL
jgi:hypothetical protein